MTKEQDVDVKEIDDVEDVSPDSTEHDDSAARATWWQGRARIVVAAVVAIVLVAGGTAWWLTRDDGVDEGVAFEVGDTTVTVDDVDARVQALVALYGVEVPTDDAGLDTFRRDAAKSMAVQLMLEDAAAERDIVVADKQVSDTLDAVIEQRYTDGGRAAFVAALGDMGATEEQVLDEIRNQLLVSAIFDDVVQDVAVSDEELAAAFEERKAELGTPVRRVLRNIVVADRPSAVRIVKRVRAGASFEAIARAESLDQSTKASGGNLGPVAATDLEPAYAEAAFGAAIGADTGPVQTQYGWNVGLVVREVAAEPAVFADVRDALRQTMLAEKSVDVWRDWLRGIIADHDVDYADDYRPADPDAVPDIDQVAPTSGETGP